METWKKINGSIHSISNFGNIKNAKTGRVLKIHKNKKGYVRIRLRFEDGKKRGFFVHRLVAVAFLPKNGELVNHINGIRDDNRVENLEWVSPLENFIHARDITKNFRFISSKKVKQLYSENSHLPIKDFFELILDNCT